MTHRKQRGAALITVMIMMGILAMVVTGLLVYVNQQRMRGAATARQTTRLSCAEAGLRIARTYYANNMANWPTYLSNPGTYNPVKTVDPAGNGYLPLAVPQNIKAQCDTSPSTCPTNIVSDLDGDGKVDVYMYIRDNEDELLPMQNNPRVDYDGLVIVGAVCVSGTLTPRMPNGEVDPDLLTVEGPMVYNLGSHCYSGQLGGCATQSNNLNNTASTQ